MCVIIFVLKIILVVFKLWVVNLILYGRRSESFHLMAAFVWYESIYRCIGYWQHTDDFGTRCVGSPDIPFKYVYEIG